MSNEWFCLVVLGGSAVPNDDSYENRAGKFPNDVDNTFCGLGGADTPEDEHVTAEDTIVLVDRCIERQRLAIVSAEAALRGIGLL